MSTSTERLLACLNHQIPDRVPISTYELVGWNRQAWENQDPSYQRLMDAIRNHTDCLYMLELPVPNASKDEIDTTVDNWDQNNHHFTRTTIHTDKGDLTKVVSYTDDVHTIWTHEHPVKNLDDLSIYMNLPWSPGEVDFKPLEAAWADLGSDHGLPLISVYDPICEMAEAFEFSDFMIHAMTETQAIAQAMEQLHERYIASLEKVLSGPIHNAVFRICGPEYATRPYLPPELFRQFVTRYDSHYIRMIQQAGSFARLHAHGNIAGILDQIADMAPDALDPIEPPPDGNVDLATLKQKIGDTICLMGNLELHQLENATEDQIEAITRQTLAEGKSNGNFVIMPTAAPINTPLSPQTEKNYIRFIETSLEYGGYDGGI